MYYRIVTEPFKHVLQGSTRFVLDEFGLRFRNFGAIHIKILDEIFLFQVQ